MRVPVTLSLAFYAGLLEGRTPRAHVLDCFLGSAELDRKLRPPRVEPASPRA